MTPLELVRLSELMERTSGRPEVAVGLIDGPVLAGHPDLAGASRRVLPGKDGAACAQAASAACLHGTFVAGILFGRRGSKAPSICPGCTLLSRPIFAEAGGKGGAMPSATPEELARAILDCLAAGARVLNVSASITQSGLKSEQSLENALNEAARRGVIVVVAAGNEGTLGSTALTRHLWVVPVVACDPSGRPMVQSNIGGSIGRRGLGAPGQGITSLGAAESPLTLTGTSAAAPFVTGGVALLWSEFPDASAVEMRLAITQPDFGRRTTVVPPLFDAGMAYEWLAALKPGRRSA